MVKTRHKRCLSCGAAIDVPANRLCCPECNAQLPYPPVEVAEEQPVVPLPAEAATAVYDAPEPRTLPAGATDSDEIPAYVDPSRKERLYWDGNWEFRDDPADLTIEEVIGFRGRAL